MASYIFVAIATIFFHGIAFGHPDEVTDLPGLPSQPKFKQYSGYLNATKDKFLHYWFVESQNNPTTDPLLLWLNGGPGCSSLEGFLGEHGPFRVDAKGKSLSVNDYSWNTLFNVLYLEAPAGVGFSYSLDKKYQTDDDKVSMDNYIALQSFFKKFPQFAKNDFYITGESYGGIYVPTLTVRVLNGSAPIKIKGFAVGNGMSSYPLNDNSLIFFIYHHGLFGIDLWSRLTKHCCTGGVSQSTCNFHNNNDPQCTSAVSDATVIIMGSGLNPYNLYDTCDTSSVTKTSRLYTELNTFFRFSKFNTNLLLKKHRNRGAGLEVPCIDSSDIEAYLNRADVRKALHIPANMGNWTVCSDQVSGQYKVLYQSMEEQYHFILRKLRGLVYNGDIDMMCNFLGDEWFVDSLGLQVVSNYTYWKIGNQVGGFVKRFNNLDFVTIRGAGHMVPSDKPQEALKMISSFIFKKPY